MCVRASFAKIRVSLSLLLLASLMVSFLPFQERTAAAAEDSDYKIIGYYPGARTAGVIPYGKWTSPR